MEPRFFLPGAPLAGLLTLCPEDEAHVTRVLRMKKGEKLTVCDGAGREAACEWTGGGASVLSVRDCECEPACAVHLYPSLAKGERFEWMIQKAVELGAASVTPVYSGRCIARMPDQNRLVRWRRIAREAACQCGRGILSEIFPAIDFDAAARSAPGVKIFCYEEAAEGSLPRALGSGSVFSVFTGPEGGYTPEESALAAAQGCVTVTLGRRILRCETAPLFVLAALEYEALRG